MLRPDPAPKEVRFGEFRLNLDTGELSNNGDKSTLSEKPFQLLVALLEKSGQLVTRDELKRRLWGEDTFVDFDLGLNKAVNRLREALKDSADNPRFIETLPKRGYRFIGSLQEERHGESKSEAAAPPVPQDYIFVPDSTGRNYLALAGFLTITVLLASGAVFLRMKRIAKAPELRLKQLTWNSAEVPVRSAVISPDGKYLAYTDRNGIHVTALATNESRVVSQPESLTGRIDWQVIGWFPDSTRFVAQTSPQVEICLECVPFSTWVVSVAGDTPRKIREGVNAESISPDGRRIAFTSVLGEPGGRKIGVMDADGDHLRDLYETDQKSWMRYVRWSPDGKRLAYVLVRDTPGLDWTLESRDLQGGGLQIIVANANAVQHDFAWLANGNLIYGTDEPDENGCNYWKLKVDTRSGRPDGEARKLTHWAGFCVDSTSVTADGKRMAFTESVDRATIFVAQLGKDGTHINGARRLSLIEGLNWPVGWASDSKSLVFASLRERATILYKQALNSDVAGLILPEVNGTSQSMRVTPDGQWVLFMEESREGVSGEKRRLMRAPVAGGRPQEVFSGALRGARCARLPATLCVVAEWTEDHHQVIFSALDLKAGKGRELCRSDSAATGHLAWELSPDGNKLLLIHAGAKEPLEVVWLSDGHRRFIPLSGWNVSDNTNWSTDSKGLYVASPTQRGCALLHVDLEGRTAVLWEQRGGLSTVGLPSPDGRQLALTSWSLNSNVWVMDNF